MVNRKKLLIVAVLISIFCVLIGLLLINHKFNTKQELTQNPESYSGNEVRVSMSLTTQRRIEFNLKIPTINMNKPSAGDITGYYIQDEDYNIVKSQFKLSVNEVDLGISFRPNPGDSGFGFVPYLSKVECMVVSSLDNIELCRILAEDFGTITSYNSELGSDYEYLYHYTDSYAEGPDCGTIEGYSCPAPYFEVKGQLFQFICGVNKESDVKNCDEFVNNLFIEKVLREE